MIEHYYQEIPGWCDFEDIYAEMVERTNDRIVDGAQFVEVGSCFGKSLAFLATEIVNSGKRIRLDSVDHMGTFVVGDAYANEAQHIKARVWEGFELEAIIKRNLWPCTKAGLVHYHHKRRSDNSDGFENLDFVFLDACHDYEGIKAEIAAWWPKVKVGGYLGGHDHTVEYPGVMRAVREAFGGRAVSRGNSFLIQKC